MLKDDLSVALFGKNFAAPSAPVVPRFNRGTQVIVCWQADLDSPVKPQNDGSN